MAKHNSELVGIRGRRSTTCSVSSLPICGFVVLDLGETCSYDWEQLLAVLNMA